MSFKKLFKLLVASDVFINREGPVCGGWGVLVCAIGENGTGGGACPDILNQRMFLV